MRNVNKIIITGTITLIPMDEITDLYDDHGSDGFPTAGGVVTTTSSTPNSSDSDNYDDDGEEWGFEIEDDIDASSRDGTTSTLPGTVKDYIRQAKVKRSITAHTDGSSTLSSPSPSWGTRGTVPMSDAVDTDTSASAAAVSDALVRTNRSALPPSTGPLERPIASRNDRATLLWRRTARMDDGI